MSSLASRSRSANPERGHAKRDQRTHSNVIDEHLARVPKLPVVDRLERVRDSQIENDRHGFFRAVLACTVSFPAQRDSSGGGEAPTDIKRCPTPLRVFGPTAPALSVHDGLPSVCHVMYPSDSPGFDSHPYWHEERETLSDQSRERERCQGLESNSRSRILHRRAGTHRSEFPSQPSKLVGTHHPVERAREFRPETNGEAVS